MDESLSVYQERIDDVPLIIGLAQQLQMVEILDKQLGTHGLQQGLNNGQLTVGWLAYILSQADHRKSAVRDWANSLSHTLQQLLGQPLRAVDFSDDRLGGVLRRLSDDAAWAAIEHDLWRATLEVYELALSGVRLDATSSYGYHQVSDGGLMQYGHSQDHRADLPQLKLMAAAAEPSGQLIASDVQAGHCADDPLYTPLVARVRQVLGRSGVLYAGDCKMAALSTRADIVAHHDYYLMPLPLTGETAQQFGQWVNAAVEGAQPVSLLWDTDQLFAAGYEFERPQQALWTDAEGMAHPLQWTERVQVFRSRALAAQQQAQLDKRLNTAQAALLALTPAPARGKRQMRDEATLQEAIAQVLTRYDVQDLLSVEWQRQESTITHQVGRGRPGPARQTRPDTQVRYAIVNVQVNARALAAQRERLGWRVQVSNAPSTHLDLTQAVLHYREGYCLERDFHLVKDLPLGLSPLFVWRQDQLTGLVRLLTLALRLLTLIESQVRQALAREQHSLSGLYEGQAQRRSDHPSGKRLLRAFARAQLTLTRIELGAHTRWHLTPLSELHQMILRYLRLPESLYTNLFANSP